MYGAELFENEFLNFMKTEKQNEIDTRGEIIDNE